MLRQASVLLLPVLLLSLPAVSVATDPCAAGDECEEFCSDARFASRYHEVPRRQVDIGRPRSGEPCIHRYHTAHTGPTRIAGRIAVRCAPPRSAARLDVGDYVVRRPFRQHQ
jgi:hypothetical protein